jgi:hypothetical protein
MKTDLEYALQACRNLEGEMLARGWFAEAAHFRLRQKQIQRQMKETK